MDYDTAIQTLLERLGSGSPSYAEALVLQSRLLENQRKERVFGSTETRRAERAEIIHALNSIALTTLGTSFNDFVHGEAPRPPQEDRQKISTSQPGSAHATTTAPDPRHIRTVLQAHFNTEELRGLCFDLGVDLDDIEGTTLSTKALHVVGYFQRRGRIAELVAAIHEARPNAM